MYNKENDNFEMFNKQNGQKLPPFLLTRMIKTKFNSEWYEVE